MSITHLVHTLAVHFLQDVIFLCYSEKKYNFNSNIEGEMQVILHTLVHKEQLSLCRMEKSITLKAQNFNFILQVQLVMCQEMEKKKVVDIGVKTKTMDHLGSTFLLTLPSVLLRAGISSLSPSFSLSTHRHTHIYVCVFIHMFMIQKVKLLQEIDVSIQY